MSRTEHMRWAKDRALACLVDGDTTEALMSFLSDTGKHDEIASNPAVTMLLTLVGPTHVGDVDGMRKFIDGFA